MTEDKCCSLAPYFKVHENQMDSFRQLCEQFIEKTQTESKCLYYGFSFNGDVVHCREGYADAEGLLQHLENVGEILQESLKIADLIRLEVHGCESELDKLRQPLAKLNPEFFVLEYSFHR